MSKQTDPTTGQSAPDTATSYERAKPEEESPSKALDLPKPPASHQQDELAQNANPQSKKKADKSHE
ncbi:MAG TPA: hypothetical protein VF595_11445 [Tepidisphaeraceae bacterium]|jgi:hypothetical protein